MRLLWTASQSHPISQGKTGWLPRLGILGFSFYHFTARWGRINTTLNSLLIQSFSSSSLILLLGWCRAQLRSGAAKHYNEIISLLVFSTNITSSSHFQWLQGREKQALIAFSSHFRALSAWGRGNVLGTKRERRGRTLWNLTDTRICNCLNTVPNPSWSWPWVWLSQTNSHQLVSAPSAHR